MLIKRGWRSRRLKGCKAAQDVGKCMQEQEMQRVNYSTRWIESACTNLRARTRRGEDVLTRVYTFRVEANRWQANGEWNERD